MKFKPVVPLPFKDPDYLADLASKGVHTGVAPTVEDNPDDRLPNNVAVGPIKDPDYLKDLATHDFPRKVAGDAGDLWGENTLIN